MNDAYVALGSNQGDRVAMLREALREMAEVPGLAVLDVSPAYESEPWGVEDQPAFANAVAKVRFAGEADTLLTALQDIEERLGRVRCERFGPRPIDLDILLFGDEEWGSPGLTIPHPRMLERDFVVSPLLDVWPDAVLPDGSRVTRGAAVLGRVTGVLARLGDEPLEPAEVHPAPEDGAPEVRPTASEAEEQWVAVGPSRFETSTSNSSADFDQLLFEIALKQAGIPSEFYPHRPGEGASFLYGLPVEVRLMVPRSREAEARAIVDALVRGA